MTKEEFEEQCRKVLAYENKDLVWSPTGFVEYWTEKNLKGTKMRFEKEKVFDIKRRFATWKKYDSERNDRFKKPEPTPINASAQKTTAEAPIHIPQEAKDSVTKEGLLKRFKSFKETGNIGFLASRAYDALKAVKGVKTLVDKDTFFKVKAELEPRWTDTVKIEKLKAERSGNLSTAEQFAELLANGIENYEPFQKAMKERLLKEYFKGIDKLEI